MKIKVVFRKKIDNEQFKKSSKKFMQQAVTEKPQLLKILHDYVKH